jgi:hypothetical protein
VAITLTSGRRVRGYLQAINDDHFVLVRDVDFKLEEIPYGEVERIARSLSTCAKRVVWVVAVFAGLCVLGAMTPEGSR